MHTAYIQSLTPEQIQLLNHVIQTYDSSFVPSSSRHVSYRLRIYEQIIGTLLAEHWGARFKPHLTQSYVQLQQYVRTCTNKEILLSVLKPIPLWQVTFHVEFIDPVSFIVYEEGARRPCAPII